MPKLQIAFTVMFAWCVLSTYLIHLYRKWLLAEEVAHQITKNLLNHNNSLYVEERMTLQRGVSFYQEELRKCEATCFGLSKALGVLSLKSPPKEKSILDRLLDDSSGPKP